MSKPVVAVVVCALLALVAASLRVPVRWWLEVSAQVTDERRATLADQALLSSVRQDLGSKRALLFHRVLSDGPEPVQATWPVRFRWVWSSRTRYDSGIIHSHERIRWGVLGSIQALILLLGGGLLTYVVRRERRRKAAA
jgi:hypothetical protein